MSNYRVSVSFGGGDFYYTVSRGLMVSSRIYNVFSIESITRGESCLFNPYPQAPVQLDHKTSFRGSYFRQSLYVRAVEPYPWIEYNMPLRLVMFHVP